ncbi:helix-turn-helix transcriptional regulator [Streptomyces sp. WMMC500]|uniref:helix-turn-helix domain-containing protein n=1 Tax=Streptomyces sp. WMMC500 TaxID=3015154 RepID=UPI00248A92F1|nr:helix-turn-helix transcriptional regulator [Streptomyces sp. WMMC500]WBB57764.1 helix-turn-helix transcriptional regulator [Streptomyces sp. WMMC500]
MPARPRELTPERSARHLFGAKMRAHRMRAGMSLEALNDVVNISRSHLSRIETADAMPPPDLPPRLDAAFGTDGIFRELYLIAAREIHPDQFKRLMELEARARVIAEYSSQIVPGRLQTEGYARAQFRAANPWASEDRIEELVAARLSRQSVLGSDTLMDYSAVLDEAMLRRGFGGPEVMRAQLARLAELTLTHTTMIQVVPFDVGGHGLAGGTLVLMTMEDGARFAYEEGITTGTLMEDLESVVERQRVYDLVRVSALPPDESAAFIRSVMEVLPT